ncbi:hypothetical protein Pfo_000063 [Paulownia fortunei]|nr:hypothetical protein Pfo_000063 [Paulownia fortunei]
MLRIVVKLRGYCLLNLFHKIKLIQQLSLQFSLLVLGSNREAPVVSWPCGRQTVDVGNVNLLCGALHVIHLSGNRN